MQREYVFGHWVRADHQWVRADRSNIIAAALVESGWQIKVDPEDARRVVYISAEDWYLACDIWSQLILLKTEDLGAALKPIVKLGREHAQWRLEALKALVALSQ